MFITIIILYNTSTPLCLNKQNIRAYILEWAY